MGRKRRRLRRLAAELARTHPEIDDPLASIAAGHVLVDGLVVDNPDSLVREGASIAQRRVETLRGELKLRAALSGFVVPIRGRVALDLGAAAGGFTKALLDAGAARIYAVDAGSGQLLGSLRQDPRVVNLERTNLGRLSRTLICEPVDVVTIDLSYLAIARAAPQLETLVVARDADLVALVKPMFELQLDRPPTEPDVVRAAVEAAARGLEATGWGVLASIPSPITGARGAIEQFVHARRR